MTEPTARLDDLSRDEWWDVSRRLNPGLAREQFDAHWEEFQRLKAERARAQELQ